jgi:hypothetical protein
MKGKPRYLKPEIYSDGTLRLRDIANAQFSALDSIRLTRSERSQVVKAKRAYRKLEKLNYDRPMDFYGDTDTLSYYVNEALIYVLDAHCLPYCYWGSAEGDGASIGVWVDVATIEDDLRHGELPYLSEESPGHRGLIADVSDHGNITLIDRRAFGRGYKDAVLWEVV